MNLIKIFDAFIDDLSSISPENLKQTGGDDQNGNNDNAKYWELAERLFVFAGADKETLLISFFGLSGISFRSAFRAAFELFGYSAIVTLLLSP